MAERKEENFLKTLLTQDVLLELLGDRSFTRGEDYVRRGYVHDLAPEGDSLSARVSAIGGMSSRVASSPSLADSLRNGTIPTIVAA
jgi:uncharacterized Zn finger protein